MCCIQIKRSRLSTLLTESLRDVHRSLVYKIFVFCTLYNLYNNNNGGNRKKYGQLLFPLFGQTKLQKKLI